MTEKKLNKISDFQEDLEIEKLLDRIESRQTQQLQIINNKNNHINNLVSEIKNLNEQLSKKDRDLTLLSRELDRLKKVAYEAEVKYQTEIEQVNSIIEISKKIEEQNKEIQILEKINNEQKAKFEEFKK